jgi:polyribonucleotide nucleotidyltransferase
MDIKIGGINAQIMVEALSRPRRVDCIFSAPWSRPWLSANGDLGAGSAHHQIKINPDKIRDVIGPGER